MNSRFNLLLLTLLIVSNLVGLWLFVANTRPSISLDNVTKRVPASMPRNLHGGAKIQRERIVQFTDKVGSQSILELEKTLADKEFTVYDAGAGFTFLGSYCHFQAILADRRVAKIYAEYSQLSKLESQDRSSKMFNFYLKEHSMKLDRLIEDYKMMGGYNLTINLKESTHACAASIFLMSQFCPISTIDPAIQKWKDVGTSALDQVRGERDDIEMMTIRNIAMPLDLFIFNAYLVTLQLHLDGQEFSSILSEEIKLLRVSKLASAPFLTWDAHTNPFDFTHKHKGIPYDASNVLATYQYAKGWSSIYSHTEPSRQGYLKRAQAAVQSAEKTSSAGGPG